MRITTDELMNLLSEERKRTDRLMITVDGPCASGKTTLAAELAGALHAAVVHTDDYVIPHARKTAERLAEPGGNCDAERLAREVIVPWKKGLPGQTRRYDCVADRLREPEDLPAENVLILEGSYCNLPLLREHADVRVFLDPPRELRLERLQKRESAASLRRFLDLWIPLEDAYFEAFGLPDEGCVLIRP